MPQKHRLCPNQAGVVIVVALFMVALAATLATVMMVRFDRDLARTQLLLHDQQANQYAQASVAWAILQLTTDWKNQKQNQLVDQLPLTSPAQVQQGYRIQSTIQDAQALFNLNNITMEDANSANVNFLRLIQLVQPEMSREKALNIVHAIGDWVSPLTKASSYDDYYAKRSPAYRAPHHLMVDASELLLVRGVTQALYGAIKPYIVALPENNLPLNIATIPPLLFAMLSPAISLSAAEGLVAMRKETPFTSVEMAMALPALKGHVADGHFAVISQYFIVETHVTIDSEDHVLYTLLQRKENGDQSGVFILWQSTA